MAIKLPRKNSASEEMIKKAIQELMPKDDILKVNGTVSTVLPGGMFRIKLENGHEVLGHLSGRMRKNHIRILENDKVDVEISPYDLTKGRVIYRYK